MIKTNDGGGAFPHIKGTDGYGDCLRVTRGDGSHDFLEIEKGMTLRDYFAAAALQGILASFDVTSRRRAEVEPEIMHRIAPAAYLLADAMLAERERGQQ